MNLWTCKTRKRAQLVSRCHIVEIRVRILILAGGARGVGVDIHGYVRVWLASWRQLQICDKKIDPASFRQSDPVSHTDSNYVSH